MATPRQKRRRQQQRTIQAAAGRRAKGRKGGRKGVSRDTMTDIRYGLGGTHNARAVWKGMNKRQRVVAKRIAARRGVSLQGLLGGGPRALQERTPTGLRKQAERTARSAWAPATQELDQQEVRARALLAKQTEDEKYFQTWLAGQHAEMRTRANVADEALRSQFKQIADAQNQSFNQDAAAQGDTTSNTDAAGRAVAKIRLAQQASAGQTAAAQRNAESSIRSGADFREALARSTETAGINQRFANTSRFYEELRNIGEGRKDVAAKRAADTAKEIARLRDQQIEVAQANRESRMLGRELGIKEYEAATERRLGNAEMKLNWKEYRRKLSDQQVKAALKRVELQLKSRDLSRKERADLEKARHNLAQENQNRINEEGRNARDRSGGGGPGGREWSEGARNRWGSVVNLSNYNKPPKGVPRLLWRASRAIKTGGRLTVPMYRALVEANVAVPPRYRPRSRGSWGPH